MVSCSRCSPRYSARPGRGWRHSPIFVRCWPSPATAGRAGSWQAAGHATPRRMQALLAEHRWDWQTALTALQHFILHHLGEAGAALVLDETAELKQGQMTVGVARQHAGITGQVENCQTVVNCAYVTACGHALFDFRLYLPRAWCRDRGRRERAQVPCDVQFQTKTELATGMLAGHAAAGVPFAWWPATNCTGAPRSCARPASRPARGTCSRSRPASRPRCRPGGRSRSRRWPRCCPGNPLVRAGLQGPPRLRLAVGQRLVAAALGADPPQPLRPRRPGVLLLPRSGRLAGVPAPLPQHGGTPASAGTQPAAWADTGILPASPGQPPPEDPGLVKVSVPEARRLLRLATTPIGPAAASRPVCPAAGNESG